MTKVEKPLIVFDVDWTIYDCGNPPRLRPGIDLLLGALSTMGAEVHLWSAGGKYHCEDIAHKFELTKYISGFHDKPNFPPTEKDAIAILGRVASLQIDDDENEKVSDWPFLHVTPFTIDSL